MSKVKLGDVAIEFKEKCNGNCLGLPSVGLEHLIPGEVRLSEWEENAENTFTKSFKKGHILFGRRRAYQKKASVATLDGKCSGDITVIEAKKDKINEELLPFIIQNDIFFDYAVSKSAGSLSPRVKWSHLKEYEFSLPDKSEQDKIADLLWAIEENIESYNKLIFQTEEIVKAKFIKMFYEDNKYKDITKKLGSTTSVTAGQTSPKEGEFSDSGIPFIKAGNLYDLIYTRDFTEADCLLVSDKLAKDKKLKLHKKGTILFAKSGMSCLKGHVYTLKKDAYVVSHLACIYPKDEIYNSRFLEYYFKDLKVQTLVGKNSYPTISIGTLKNLKAPLPPKEKQDEFEKIVLASEESLRDLKKSTNKLIGVKKSIIKKYFG
ncbi:MAG: restriction endonuclease subunit S [Anaerovoracaceae bacterium]|jgi:type I restriction enzyme S subunit